MEERKAGREGRERAIKAAVGLSSAELEKKTLIGLEAAQCPDARLERCEAADDGGASSCFCLRDPGGDGTRPRPLR